MTPTEKTSQPRPRKTWSAGTLTYTAGGLAALFAWLLFGDFSWSMQDRSLGQMGAWYLKHIQVSNFVFGFVIITVPNLLAMVFTPVVCYRSDRHRGRFGRRIPFLIVTAGVASVCMIGMGFCPFIGPWVNGIFGGAEGGARTATVWCFALFWGTFMFCNTTSKQLFDGLANDVVPRQFIGRFYGLFRAISLMDGIIFGYFIFGHVEKFYTLILCVVGAVYGLSFTGVCLKVKEGAYPPPPPAPAGGAPGSLAGSVKTYGRECFSNPYYIGVFVLITLGMVTFQPVNIFSIPFANSLGISMDTYGKCLAITYGCSFALSYFIGWLSDKFHPLRMSMIFLLIYAVTTALGAWRATATAPYMAVLIAHGVTSGCYFTSAASLGLRLYPGSRFAQFASAAGIFTALANMTVAPAVGKLIDATGNNYRHSYLTGSVLALLALGVAAWVRARVMRLGGYKDYVAPE
jgi:MFS family permease